MKKTVSTIRRKIILPIIILVVAVLALFGLVACGEELITENDIIDMGYEYLVVYDFNGGLVNAENKSATIRVMKDSHIPEPGSEFNQDFQSPSYTGHSLKGFYKAETRYNEETEKYEVVYDKYVQITSSSGRVTYEPYIESDADSEEADGSSDDKKPVIVEFARASDEEWDFAKGTVNEDMTLVAVWWDNFKIDILCGETTSSVEVPRQKNGDPNNVTARSMNVSGVTILNYYLDSAMTNEIKAQTIGSGTVFSIDREYFENSADKLTATIWCNYLDGNYQVITSETSFMSLSFGQDINVYLDCDLNMADRSRSFPDSYNGIFLGNGHTISNLTIEKSLSGTNYEAGMFNTLMSGAVISDVNFVNVSLIVKLENATAANYTIGMLAGKTLDGSTVENVNVDGTVTYEVPIGLAANAVTFDDSSLFGDASQGTNVTGSTVDIKSYTGSEIVYSNDEKKQFAVCVWFTVKDGVKEYGAAYALGSLNSRGTYTKLSTNLAYDEENDQYTCTASRVNYTIKIIEDGDGIYAQVTTG